MQWATEVLSNLSRSWWMSWGRVTLLIWGLGIESRYFLCCLFSSVFCFQCCSGFFGKILKTNFFLRMRYCKIQALQLSILFIGRFDLVFSLGWFGFRALDFGKSWYYLCLCPEDFGLCGCLLIRFFFVLCCWCVLE